MSVEKLGLETNPIDPEWKVKEERLARIRVGLEKVADAEGHGIDEGIKETVAISNALGFPTAQSCEGHIRTGRPYPWVRIAAPGEPSERFIGKDELFNRIARENNVPLEELKRGTPENLYWEIIKR